MLEHFEMGLFWGVGGAGFSHWMAVFFFGHIHSTFVICVSIVISGLRDSGLQCSLTAWFSGRSLWSQFSVLDSVTGRPSCSDQRRPFPWPQCNTSSLSRWSFLFGMFCSCQHSAHLLTRLTNIPPPPLHPSGTSSSLPFLETGYCKFGLASIRKSLLAVTL